MRKGWVIFDRKTRRPYIPVGFASEKSAEAELAALLEPYPAADPWHARLDVRYVVRKPRKRPAKRAAAVDLRALGTPLGAFLAAA